MRHISSTRAQSGQSLIELVIGIGVGIIFITGALGIVTLALRLDFENKFSQTASELVQTISEEISTMANASWHNLLTDVNGDPITHASNSPYHVVEDNGFFKASPGTDTVTLNDQNYTVSFTIADLDRNSAPGESGIVETGTGISDPSTAEITITVSWDQDGNTGEVVFKRILTRNRDRIWHQTDWSGGEPQAGPFSEKHAYIFYSINVATTTVAGQITIEDTNANKQATAGNGIDPNYPYAWNDVIGWINFARYGNVTVDSTFTGYVGSNVGDIALNCSSTPNGNICANPPTFGVTKDTSGTSAGTLSGYAWNDAIGWISFNSDNCDSNSNGFTDVICNGDDTSTAVIPYSVTIDPAGFFNGYAWNDVAGWISFNCANPGTNGCSSPGIDYKVKTGSVMISVGELISSTFDTAQVNGAAWNTILWSGTKPTGTGVKFQFATSNCSNGAIDAGSCSVSPGWGGGKLTGDGAFVGREGTSSDYYEPTAADIQEALKRAHQNNKRFIRYKVLLQSYNLIDTPTITDIILNWSL